MVGLQRYGAELAPPSFGSPQFPPSDAFVVSDTLSCEMPLRKFERSCGCQAVARSTHNLDLQHRRPLTPHGHRKRIGVLFTTGTELRRRATC
jgi:hypothetical protein